MKKIFTTIFLFFVCALFIHAQDKKPPKLIGRTHEHFTLFWSAFKKAVLANDSVKLSTMVSYPFTDNNTIYRGVEKTLTCVNESDFLMNYNLLFPPHVKQAIKNDKYRCFKLKVNEDSDGDVITKGQYILQPSTQEHPQYYDYIFAKVKGIYKMIKTAYYP
jgi:hypothetical protein